MGYFLAIDIGASSGRHILGKVKNGRMSLEEVHRFSNQMTNKDGILCWDKEYLFGEILEGMRKCKALGKIPESISVDTWAVDYVLLDKNGQALGPMAAYRDARTKGMDQKVSCFISEEELYRRTGIQKQIFNTIYQLMAVKEQQPEFFGQAETFLMVPDYFHYLLTGKKMVEYTNATTTQLVNAETKEWDWELIRTLGYPENMFPPISQAGTVLGELTDEICKKVGFNCKVVLPATHDTGSAVMAMPCVKDTGLYISSGTWSLMGTEIHAPLCTKESRIKNLTNEGGYDHRFRLLKNIMGLWMIQSVRHNYNDQYSFGEICAMADACGDFPSVVDVNDEVFLAPAHMSQEIQNYCRKTDQKVPRTLGEIASVVYRSLAKCYGETIKEIEQISGCTYDCIYIIGGGANADYLNQLTADATKKKVSAGPVEATAIGNIMAQMLAAGVFQNLSEARECVAHSFEPKIYEPGGKTNDNYRTL